MVLTPEQLSAANKANMDTLNNLSKHAFEGIEKLLELNLQVIKTMMQEQMSSIKASANTKDAQELLVTQAQFIQPFAEKLTSYSRHLQNISYETQKALIETASENMQERSAKIQSLITEMTAQTPATGEAMINSIKLAIANANQVYESSQKAIKQAIDISSNQTKSITESALRASEELSKFASK